MKISLERDALLAQLQTAARVASTRSAIQALSGVQLVAASTSCELRATDMDVSLRVPLAAEVVREGVVVLPARLLLDVVRALPAPQVSLELRAAEQDVELISGNATFHIRTLRAEDFPPFPEPDPESGISMPVEAFVATASKVAGSASRDETRPVLTGILVSASEQRAADGCDRLLPPERQGDDARRAALLGVRGQRARACPPGARPGGGGRRGEAAQRERAPEPGGVRASTV